MDYSDMEGRRDKKRAGGWTTAQVVNSVLLVIACVLLIVVLVKVEHNSSSSNSSSNDPTPSTTPTSGLCTAACEQVCIGKSSAACFKPCLDTCNTPPPQANSAVGGWLKMDAIHHVGATVKNLTRTTAFFVDILGGVEVPHAGGDGWFGDEVEQLLFQVDILNAKENGKTQKEAQIAQLQNAGVDRLAATYVNFGALQVELLDYRARNASDASKSDLPFAPSSTSPSVYNHMHICFHVDEAKSLNQFLLDFEQIAHDAGYPEVKCNRIISVSSEAERIAVGKQLRYNSYLVTSGNFMGWQLSYCKGPENIQFEFSQAHSLAGREFAQAVTEYMGSKPVN